MRYPLTHTIAMAAVLLAVGPWPVGAAAVEIDIPPRPKPDPTIPGDFPLDPTRPDKREPTITIDQPTIDSKITHAFLATGVQTFIVEYDRPGDSPSREVDLGDDVVFEDFEHERYRGWVASGDAFGKGPTRVEQLGSDTGAQDPNGAALALSTAGGEGNDANDLTGTLTSRSFTITHEFIRFLISGGSHTEKAALHLIVDGKTVRTATGRNELDMQVVHFNVRDLIGKRAYFKIVDDAKGPWGFIGVDHIVFSNAIKDHRRIGNGRVVWRYPKATRDGWVLPNGRILLALAKVGDFAGGVVEIDREGRVFFEYKGTQTDVDTVAPLPDGGVLLTESGAKPRLLELDRDGKVVVEFPFVTKTDNAGMQTRSARKLSNGNYLVSHHIAKVVREYNAEGDTVWEVTPPDWPIAAIRLESGRTLVSCASGEVVELDADGQVVWKVTSQDLKGVILRDPRGLQRLPNGNTVICDYAAGREGGYKLIEVTTDKQVVWTYTDNSRNGIYTVHILDTNGKPLEGEPLR